MNISFQTMMLLASSLDYFSLTGSYEGGVKINGKWQRAKNLNYVDKRTWRRIETGAMTSSMKKCLNNKEIIDFKNI